MKVKKHTKNQNFCISMVLIVRFLRVSTTVTTDIIIKSTIKIASDENSGVTCVGVEVLLVGEEEVGLMAD